MLVMTTGYMTRKLRAALRGEPDPPEVLTLGLFRNPVVTTPGTSWGDIEEATFAGYTRYLIDPTEWVEVPSPVVGWPCLEPDGPPFRWAVTAMSGEIIFGHFLADSNGELAWTERWLVPYEMRYPGDKIDLGLPVLGGSVIVV